MMKNKFGQFLLVIGFTLLVIYFSTYLIAQPQLSLLLCSLVLIVIGIQMKMKGAPPQSPSQRFSTAKRILRKNSPANDGS